MFNFPNVDLPWIIRVFGPAFYIAFTIYFFETYELTNASAKFEPSISTLIVIGAVGLLTDALSLYKAHPIYRVIRRKFFLAVFDAYFDFSEKPPSSPKERIRLAEQYREEV